ncbi:MAG: filamentous hemagglutinin N-terminal domain-containing protein, partial [Methylococcales bacterium]|nr:filamentous hemagglutinin N-terminal domain-containing protein [Methylococcales bacterium]
MKLSPLLFSITFLLSIPASSYAELQTDGSAGANVNLSGQMTVPQSLGKTVGNNLFHSFKTFNINTGENATFTGNAALKNVISRVTGGTPSLLDGLLKSSIPNADFYFINPAGVAFGANAQVNVPNGFHVSTANKLTFDNGAVFNVDTNAIGSSFGTASPESFGFLGDQSGDIDIKGSQLTFKEKSLVTLSARDIGVLNATVLNSDGDLQLYATGSEKIDISLTNLPTTFLSGQLLINASTFNDGQGKLIDDPQVDSIAKVLLFADFLDLNLSQINANNFGASDGLVQQKGIGFFAKTININRAIIASNAYSSGNAGTIGIITEDLSIVNNGLIMSDAHGQGNASKIFINSKNILIDRQAGFTTQTGVMSTVKARANGQASNIKIEANNILINGQQKFITGIYSETNTGSIGNAGSIAIESDDLTVVNGGGITSLTASQGNSGAIDIVSKNITVNGNGSETLISSQAIASSSGKAQDISLKSNNLTLLNNGFISSITKSTGNAGTVIVDSKNIKINGQEKNAGILSVSTSRGDSGVISIRSNDLAVLNGGVISNSTLGQGDAGAIIIDSKNITIDGQGEKTIISSDAKANSTGNAGGVIIKSDNLTLLNRGFISSETLGQGNSGAIIIDSKNITIDGKGQLAGMTNEIKENASGQGGFIIVKSNNLSLLDGGVISSNTLGQEDAGDIFIESKNINIDAQGKPIRITSNEQEKLAGITSSAKENSSGQGGLIIVKSDNLSLLDGGLINSSTFGKGNAKGVIVESKNINIDGQGVGTGILSATTSSGDAGKVIVISDNLTVLKHGFISSTTLGEGDAGTVLVESKNIKLDGQGIGTGITSDVEETSKGKASTKTSTVIVNTDNLMILDGARISSFTKGKKNAGKVEVNANNIVINNRQHSPSPTGILSNAEANSEGKAGTVVVNSNHILIQDGGRISSATDSIGDAGKVNIKSQRLVIDGTYDIEGTETGVYSDAYADSHGDAGTVTIKSHEITLLNKGQISSETVAKGAAGSVNIHTENLSLKNKGNISSASLTTESSGKTGNVDIFVNNKLALSNGGKISIENQGSINDGSIVDDSKINIAANDVEMLNSEISSASTGNVAAGDITLNFSGALRMDPSFIKTTA